MDITEQFIKKQLKGWACDVCTSREVFLYQDFYYCKSCCAETDLVSEWFLNLFKEEAK